MINKRVMQIADAALEGEEPSRSDVLHLLRFDAYSPEAAYVCARAREVGMKACKGRGYVYAQIGVDSLPCPANCRFCSFAEVNAKAVERAAAAAGAGAAADAAVVRGEVPIGRIVHQAKLFEDAGVPLISLMATAALDFERYLDIVRAVRASVRNDTVIMANAGDLAVHEVRALKEAGATAAYHALRLGEGKLTSIDPMDRRRTIRALRTVGVPLMTGVEPLWNGVDAFELSERICDIPEFEPFCIGACNLTPVEGARIGGLKPALTGFVHYVAAITRLMCGESVPVGGIGGVAWVDAGCDPRSRGYGDDDAALKAKVASAKHRLELDGFTIPTA